MDFFEVRESLGMPNAYSPVPADGARFEERKVTLSWKPALKETASYRVFFGIDSLRAAQVVVSSGSPETAAAPDTNDSES